MFFLLFSLDDGRIRIRIRIQEAQKHTDPTDPDSDPQHCPRPLLFSVAQGIFRLSSERLSRREVCTLVQFRTQ